MTIDAVRKTMEGIERGAHEADVRKVFEGIQWILRASAGTLNKDLHSIYLELGEVADEVIEPYVKERLLAIAERLRDMTVVEDDEEE